MPSAAGSDMAHRAASSRASCMAHASPRRSMAADGGCSRFGRVRGTPHIAASVFMVVVSSSAFWIGAVRAPGQFGRGASSFTLHA